jgi:ribose transport system permease protein
MSAAAGRRPGPLARLPGVAAMLIVLVLVFALASPNFATLPNLSNVLVQSSVLLLLALPMTFVIMTEGLDISVGAVLTLGTLSVAATALATGSLLLAFLAGLGTGLAFGLFNGWLVAYLDLPPFVATLGSFSIAQGLALALSGGQSITGMPPGLLAIYSGTILHIPVPILIILVAYAVMHGLLYRTPFGTYIFALGGNREALVLAGIPPRLMLAAVYALSGLMAGIGALLLTARLNAGHPTAGIGMEFDAIAAVAVGGTAFERGNGWLFGSVLGVFAIGILRNGMDLLALPSSLEVACIGLLVIAAFLIEAIKGEQP